MYWMGKKASMGLPIGQKGSPWALCSQMDQMDSRGWRGPTESMGQELEEGKQLSWTAILCARRNKAPDWEVFLAWEQIDRGRPPAGCGDHLHEWKAGRFRNQNKPEMPARRLAEENTAITLVEEIRRACLEKLCISYPRCLEPEGLLEFGQWSIYIAIMSYLGRWESKDKVKIQLCLI